MSHWRQAFDFLRILAPFYAPDQFDSALTGLTEKQPFPSHIQYEVFQVCPQTRPTWLSSSE